jgi:hypothetical protein
MIGVLDPPNEAPRSPPPRRRGQLQLHRERKTAVKRKRCGGGSASGRPRMMGSKRIRDRSIARGSSLDGTRQALVQFRDAVVTMCVLALASAANNRGAGRSPGHAFPDQTEKGSPPR